MKNFLITLGCFIVMLLIATSHSQKKNSTYVGQLAPDFTLYDDSDTIALSDYRGEHLLLSFWSSANAASRINNKLYDNIIAENTHKPISMLSINYDRSQSLFREIFKRDFLTSGNHIYDKNGRYSAIFNDYNLKKGYKSMLIDSLGRVVAINPGTERLQEILDAMPDKHTHNV